MQYLNNRRLYKQAKVENDLWLSTQIVKASVNFVHTETFPCLPKTKLNHERQEFVKTTWNFFTE